MTICCKNRMHYFGKIINGKMCLNALGEYTWNCWNQIPQFHPHVVIDEFVCMPNHIHGILIIDDPVGTHYMRPRENINIREPKTDIWQWNNNNTHINMDACNASLQCVSESLWSIVRGFKIGVTQFARQHNIPFQRQSRFYDCIIRDAWSYNRIKQYIKNNPKNWKEDRFMW